MGLAVAHALRAADPAVRIALVDRRAELPWASTAPGSGDVIPSIDAVDPRAARRTLVDACERFGIERHPISAVLVATSDHELGLLHELRRRLREQHSLEPELLSTSNLDSFGSVGSFGSTLKFVGGLRLADAFVVDFQAMTRELSSQLAHQDIDLLLETECTSLIPVPSGVILETNRGYLRSAHVVNCAGSGAMALFGATPGSNRNLAAGRFQLSVRELSVTDRQDQPAGIVCSLRGERLVQDLDGRVRLTTCGQSMPLLSRLAKPVTRPVTVSASTLRRSHVLQSEQLVAPVGFNPRLAHVIAPTSARSVTHVLGSGLGGMFAFDAAAQVAARIGSPTLAGHHPG